MTFLASLPPHGPAREAYVRGAIATGHLDPVEWVDVQHGPVTLRVSADWLKIGGSRIPMSAANAQLAANALDAVLPTPAIVQAIERAATIVPFVRWTQYQDDSQLLRSTIVWREGNIPRVPGLIAGALKDVVLSDYMPPGRVVIFGGLDEHGERIQPVFPLHPAKGGRNPGHHAAYDGGYAHAVRVVRDACLLRGQPASVRAILSGPDAHLLGGPVAALRYPTEAITPAPVARAAWTPAPASGPLRRWHTGPRVRDLQTRLGVDADGYYGPATQRAVEALQRARGLPVTGEVDAATERALMPEEDVYEAPRILPPLTEAECRAVFGAFDWLPVGDAGGIRILGGWEADNIRTIEVPQLRNVPPYAGPRGLLRCHRLVVDPARELFAEVERRGELKWLATYDGAYVPRRVRNGQSLSNHSWGCALDINARWNPMGAQAVPRGQKGTVLPIVEIAAELGWGCGGVWSTPDWMHLAWRGGR